MEEAIVLNFKDCNKTQYLERHELQKIHKTFSNIFFLHYLYRFNYFIVSTQD